jgi:hypothetical protein
MNDPRYRKPTRPPNPNTYVRDPRMNPGEPPPEYDQEFDPRPPRRSRSPGSAPDRPPLRGPAGPEAGPGWRPPRDRDEAFAGPQRRPRGRDSADLDFERRSPREPRGPRYPDAGRSGRGTRRPEEREGWPGPRSGPDWEPGMRPRRPRRPGKASARGRSPAARRLHWRYRYGALLGIMLFAGVGGICLGFSDIGGHSTNIALLLAGIPALLISMGCAAVYIYF